MRTKKLMTIVACAMLAIAFAYGAPWAMKGPIPFQFTAGKKVLPAGNYEVVPDVDNGLVRISSSDNKAEAEVMVVTRLAGGIHSTVTDAQLVFDKVGDTYTLSEVWLPNQDGFLVHTTSGQHQHHVVHFPH